MHRIFFCYIYFGHHYSSYSSIMFAPSCSSRMCIRKRNNFAMGLAQIRHWYAPSIMCNRRWEEAVDVLMNDSRHIPHWYRRTPVCMPMWLCKAPRLLSVLLQWLHRKMCAVKWEAWWCSVKWLRKKNDLLHMPHSYGRWSECWSLCLSRSALRTNVRKQRSHLCGLQWKIKRNLGF